MSMYVHVAGTDHGIVLYYYYNNNDNYIYRVVKLTSPKLNYVIVFGAVLLLIGSLLSPLPSRNVTLISIICPVSA